MLIFDPSEHTPTKCQGMLAQVIGPRPIAMITTVDDHGVVNVAPYSYFMAVTGDPMLIAVTMGSLRTIDSEPKHTYANTMRKGEFVVNVTHDRMYPHIETAAMEWPKDRSEVDAIGWSTIPSQVVEPPSLAESPVHMECRVHQIVDLGDQEVVHSGVHVVFAEVVCLTLDESVCTPEFRVDQKALMPVGRMGLPFYNRAIPESLVEVPRIPYEEYVATQADG